MNLINMKRLVFVAFFACLTLPISVEARSLTSVAVPAIAPGESLTLPQAFELAKQRNLTIQQSRAEIEAARGRLKTSWGGLLPTVDGSLNYILYDHAESSVVNGQSIETRARHDLDAAISANLPLVSAQQWVGVSSSKKSLELSRLNAEQVRQELLFTVASAFYQAISARSTIKVYESQLEAIRHHMEMADFRHRHGVGTRLDVTRYQSEFVATRDSLIQAHYSLENARDTLKTLLCMDTLPLPEEGETLEKFPETSEEETLAGAKEHRFDLKIAKRNLEVAEKQHLANYMQFVPTLGASWQWNYQLSDPAESNSGIERSRWYAGLVLSIPLFDYTTYGDLQQTRAATRSARLAQQETLDNAELEVRQTERNYREAVDRLRMSEEKADISEESLKLAETYYENGTVSSLDVVDARNTHQNNRIDLVLKRLEKQLTKLEFFKAMGKDLQSVVK